MGYGVKVEVWGEYALFSRPELKTERVSYDVMTASAARGILESIIWHPGMRWKIDRIYVLNPIEFANVRTNEVGSKILASNVKNVMSGGNKELAIHTNQHIQQRASMVLKNVRYIIEAHFEMTKNANPSDSREKFYAMAMRRLRNGQCYSQPYFGVRQFPANFALYEKETIDTAYSMEEKDLGYMVYDLDYSDKENIVPLFTRVMMEAGVIDFANCEVIG